MFRITRGKGFHIQFENGWTISVQFGGGNYCENRWEDIDGLAGEFPGHRECPNAEVAIWGPDGTMIEMGAGDTVRGWCSPAEVLALMNETANRSA